MIFCIAAVAFLAGSLRGHWFQWSSMPQSYTMDYMAKYYPNEVETTFGTWDITDSDACNEHGGQHCQLLVRAGSFALIGTSIALGFAVISLVCTTLSMLTGRHGAQVLGGHAASIALLVEFVAIFGWCANFRTRRSCFPARSHNSDGTTSASGTCDYGPGMSCAWLAVTCLCIASFSLTHSPPSTVEDPPVEANITSTNPMQDEAVVDAVPAVAQATPVEMLNVVVPEGVAPGQLLTVTAPSGNTVQVPVPHGAVPGSQFSVQIEAPARLPPTARAPTRKTISVPRGSGCCHATVVLMALIITALVYGTKYNANPYGGIDGMCFALPSTCPSGSGFYASPFKAVEGGNRPCYLCGAQTCCTNPEAAVDYVSYFSNINGTYCNKLLKKMSCAPCSPEAVWYTEDFDLGDSNQPFHVCDTYCKSIWNQCRIYVLDKGPHSGQTLGSVYPSYDDTMCPDVFGVASTRTQAFAGRDCFSAAPLRSPHFALTTGAVALLSYALLWNSRLSRASWWA